MASLHNRVNRQELRDKIQKDPTAYITLSFYQYAHIEFPEAFRNQFYKTFAPLGVLGRVYVANEGINAQIALPEPQLDTFKNRLYEIPFLNGVRLNIAVDNNSKSFYKLTVKIRKKIVADGLNDSQFDVTRKGIHLNAEAFNELTDQPNTILVDMRNHYESEVGHFEKAICPPVATFREALPYVEQLLEENKDANLVMYCTGGIRCEKASAWMKHRGFKNVFQLEGGIIEYTRQAQTKGLKNKFVGKNFVFDERLSEKISEDIIAQCHQCGAPCDTHINCANTRCHLLFIQCSSCAEKYQHCCSTKCKTYIQLPLEEQKNTAPSMEFNGSKFSKGHYDKSFPLE
jgi:UPF0176 protein